MSDEPKKNLVLTMMPDQLTIFFPLLQKGVTVPATVGCTLKSLLCDQFAIPSDYVTDRVTTIFLDNRPVDDLERTIIQDGSRVTLSAAMPGLVGATMRRGGFYAALRQGISHVTESGAAAGESGTVRLKLFNLLLAELGPLVLARGLILEHGELADLLQDLPGQSVDLSACSGHVLLTVVFRE
ncbi:MAG TPA: hypothetical protein VN642_02200 [Dongiaceae bacterium]|nr:hypothetical protein [Dongiaceae bacterium]